MSATHATESAHASARTSAQRTSGTFTLTDEQIVTVERARRPSALELLGIGAPRVQRVVVTLGEQRVELVTLGERRVELCTGMPGVTARAPSLTSARA